MSLHLSRSHWMLAVMAALILILVSAARTDGSVRTSTTLQRVAFVSATRGVGLFEETTGKYPGRCIQYTRPTNNGGKSFGAGAARLAKTQCGNGEAFSQIAFNGSDVLFAYGPELAVSRNMGRSWTSPKMSGSVAGLATSGSSTWVLVTRCHPGQQTCMLTLLASSDGGRSWRTPGAQPPDRTVAPEVAFDGDLGMSNLLSATPDGTVVLALPRPPRTPVAPSPATATVESLQPGAGRWRETYVPCASAEFETELSIAPDGSRWLACASEPSTGLQPKSLAVSEQGGNNWRLVAGMCTLGAKCDQRMPLVGYLGGLAAVSSSTAFYVGGRGPLAGTFDGGSKWRTWPRIGGQDSGTLQVTFAGTQDGWALSQALGGGSKLWRTQDGGVTWSPA